MVAKAQPTGYTGHEHLPQFGLSEELGLQSRIVAYETYKHETVHRGQATNPACRAAFKADIEKGNTSVWEHEAHYYEISHRDVSVPGRDIRSSIKSLRINYNYQGSIPNHWGFG